MPQVMFSEQQRRAFTVASQHGFWRPEQANLYQKLALIHSEVSEALEVLREGHGTNEVWYREDGKPEGFGPELADTVIRCLDLAAWCGIDLGDFVAEKQAFNETRPYMHGKTA